MMNFEVKIRNISVQCWISLFHCLDFHRKNRINVCELKNERRNEPFQQSHRILCKLYQVSSRIPIIIKFLRFACERNFFLSCIFKSYTWCYVHIVSDVIIQSWQTSNHFYATSFYHPYYWPFLNSRENMSLVRRINFLILHYFQLSVSSRCYNELNSDWTWKLVGLFFYYQFFRHSIDRIICFLVYISLYVDNNSIRKYEFLCWIIYLLFILNFFISIKVFWMQNNLEPMFLDAICSK